MGEISTVGALGMFVSTHWTEMVALSQAFFCGGLAYLIAFKYRRKGATYKLSASLCAFLLASLFAQQWMSIVGRVLWYGIWPVVSVQNTLIFAVLFMLVARAKGNVSRMFDFSDGDRHES